MTNFFKTVSTFYKNKFIIPEAAIIRHCGWQLRKILNLFPCDIRVRNFIIRIADRSVANGCGALINAMGYYDPNNMYLLEELSKRNIFSSFFDVGANIGIYSLIVASAENTKVFAFEPHPYTFSLLKENVALNFLEDRICTVQSALGEENGDIYLTDVPGSPINRIVGQEEGVQKKISVKLIRGDTFCRDQNTAPDVMKIDVEGHENSVLRGFKSVLKNVQILFVECRSVVQTSFILCEDFGFLGPYKIDYRTRIFRKADISCEDWIFVNPLTVDSLKSANFYFETTN